MASKGQADKVGGIAPAEVTTLFGSVETLLQVNRALLAELQASTCDDPMAHAAALAKKLATAGAGPLRFYQPHVQSFPEVCASLRRLLETRPRRMVRRQDLEKRGPVGRGRVRKSRMNEDEEEVEVRPANPRVRMEIGNLPHLSTDKYTEGEARQVTNTFNPNYMETFRFDDVYDGGLIARIYVEHTSTKKPEVMGKCAVPVKALSHRRALRRWLTLEDKKGRADPTLGRIELCVRWCHNPELEVELAEEGARDPHMSKQPNELFVVLIRAKGNIVTSPG